MSATMTIGDFSRATLLSVKTLRHYHRERLLEPADVDDANGYRRYRSDQIPTAQIIRRFRDLDMPLDQIRAVLTAADLGTRDALIAQHLATLERELAHTQSAVASLRDLLDNRSSAAPVYHRTVTETTAVAITSVVTKDELVPWYLGALGELRAVVQASGISAAGPAGGIYASELFTDERGEATVFIPIAIELPRVGRIETVTVPAVELAVIVHPGSLADLDRAYGALADYVAHHALQVDGPIREHYVVGPQQTPSENDWRTEVCWPIFSTGTAV
jgi:DNA-binding transcriptional MerR regulator